MANVPDTVGQHNHAGFKDEGGAETAGTAQAVLVRLWPLSQRVLREDRRLADRYDVVRCEKRCGRDGALAHYRRPELIDGLIGHDRDLPPEGGLPEEADTPSGLEQLLLRNEAILPLFLQEVCDLYHLPARGENDFFRYSRYVIRRR